jgi:hypothetical protein
MKTADCLLKHRAHPEYTKWALSTSEDMAAVWDALVKQNKYEWLVWTATRPGIFPDSTLRRLACRFVRETPLLGGLKGWDLLTDERSRNVIEVAERYADGKATEAELAAAKAAADAAARAAVYAADATFAAAFAAARIAAARAAVHAADAVYDAKVAAADAAEVASYFADAYAARAATATRATRAARTDRTDRTTARADRTAANVARLADAASAADAESAQIKMIAALGNPFK